MVVNYTCTKKCSPQLLQCYHNFPDSHHHFCLSLFYQVFWKQLLSQVLHSLTHVPPPLHPALEATCSKHPRILHIWQQASSWRTVLHPPWVSPVSHSSNFTDAIITHRYRAHVMAYLFFMGWSKKKKAVFLIRPAQRSRGCFFVIGQATRRMGCWSVTFWAGQTKNGVVSAWITCQPTRKKPCMPDDQSVPALSVLRKLWRSYQKFFLMFFFESFLVSCSCSFAPFEACLTFLFWAIL